MHRLLFAFGLSVCLSGCLAPIIKSDALDFGGVIEDTTNKLLVMNVLRARDKAPLHFADIPQMRESIQQSVTFSWLNLFGTSRAPSSVRDAMTAGAGFQRTPSFDLNHLHSKEFITGITSPIDPKIVKYWLDRGLDRRIVLLLFFSAVEIIETQSAKGPVNTIRVANSPREAVDVIKRRTAVFRGADELRCDTQSDFERYLKLLNTLRTFFAHTYRERRLLARGVTAGMADDSKNLQAFAALDQSKVQLVYDRERGTYSLYALSTDQKVAFCFYDDADPTTPAAPQFEVIESGPGTAGDKRNCFQSVVDAGTEDSVIRAIIPSPIFFPGAAFVKDASRYCGIYNRFTGTGPSPATKPGGYPRLELRLYIRSVGEIFQFLGDLLHYQDEVRKFVEDNRLAQHKLNSPVTFGFCGDIPEPGCDDIFLRVDGDPCNARFSLTYREREYYVGNFNPPADLQPHGPNCRPDPTARRDHTLEILAVLHQLVGLHKSATDIRSTPSVNVLP
jgi:hypothetical protein